MKYASPAMNPEAKADNFYSPTTGWSGSPDILEPEYLLLDKVNTNINWEGCENAVGSFEF
ncbi:MAG: hypothetical protein AAF944_14120 [Bacteroidota bacterium]